MNHTGLIRSVDSFGVVTVWFNGTNLKPVELDVINTTNLNITVLPAENRDRYTTFKPKSLNLTWEPISWKVDVLKIQVKFKYPLEISPLLVQD